jgi:hypothetical protein
MTARRTLPVAERARHVPRPNFDLSTLNIAWLRQSSHDASNA